MTRENVTRVGLLYAPQLLRAGLRKLLESLPRVEVAWEAGDLCRAEGSGPVDLLVSDALLADGRALDLVQRSRDRGTGLRAVLLVRRAEEVQLNEGVAYLPLWAGAPELQLALDTLRGGRRYTHPDLASPLARSNARALTPGERRVLELVSDGLSAEEAAQVLQVSVNTTKTHLRGVYRKLHVRDRTQAVLEALRLGLVCPPDSNRRRQPR